MHVKKSVEHSNLEEMKTNRSSGSSMKKPQKPKDPKKIVDNAVEFINQ